MKIYRNFDSKIYVVHQESESSYLIRHPLDAGEFWIQKSAAQVVPDTTQEDYR